MNNEIDFLKAQKSAEKNSARALRLLKIGSVVLLAAYCVLASAIFSYWVYLGRESKNIAQQIETKKQKIEELKKVELLQVMLKGRLALLHGLLTQKRVNYPQVITYLRDSSPGDLVIRTVEISQEGGIIITSSAPNAQAASKFLDNLTSPNSEISFSKVALSSASRATDGVYMLNLLLRI